MATAFILYYSVYIIEENTNIYMVKVVKVSGVKLLVLALYDLTIFTELCIHTLSNRKMRHTCMYARTHTHTVL